MFKDGRVMFKAKTTKCNKGLYVMKGEEFRKACAKISEDAETYFQISWME